MSVGSNICDVTVNHDTFYSFKILECWMLWAPDATLGQDYKINIIIVNATQFTKLPPFKGP